MKYYLYHIPGVKIGLTTDLKERVERQQGYIESEYDIIMSSDDIDNISEWERKLQKNTYAGSSSNSTFCIRMSVRFKN